jgi:hypothetical protein
VARRSRRLTAALGRGEGALVKQGEDGRAWGLQGTETKVVALAIWVGMWWRGGFHCGQRAAALKGPAALCEQGGVGRDNI